MQQSKPPVYFILHVPKTAGTTTVEHLADHCARGVLWRPQPTRLLGGGDVLPDFERVRAVALGHYRGRSLEAHFAGRELRRTVLLRDPVSLQVSYYNWRMAYFLSRGQGTYSFDLHLRALPRNFVVNFLLARWLEVPWAMLMAMPDARKLDLIQHHLSQFWFVGAHTDCARLTAALAPELGVPPLAIPRNVGSERHSPGDWRPIEADKLPTATREAILADHPLDQALWQTWHSAGFDTHQVRRRVAPLARTRSSLRREVLRPAYELARVYRRGGPRWIDGVAAPPARFARIRTALAPGKNIAGGDRLRSLRQAPENPDIWRAYLTSCRQNAADADLPAALVGAPDEMRDAELCILRGEVLLCCGRGDDARRFLRFAPALARTRRQARDITLRAAAADAEFCDLVRRADRARDRLDWREGANLYRAALDLYPGHCGYMVQYAHCLKEQHEYDAAEIYYRSARALGAPLQDMQDELSLVAALQGHDERFDAAAAWRPSIRGADLLDDPPTRADIDVAWYVVAGAVCHDRDRILQTLRSAKTNRGVVDCMIRERNPLAADDRLAALAASASAQFIDTRRALAARAASRAGRA